MSIVNADRVCGAPTRDSFRYDVHRRSALNDGNRDVSKLKILIIGPPKTGNTWVKQLLSLIYDVPIVFVDYTLDIAPEMMNGLGDRWAAHQHWLLTPDLLRWGHENGVVFVTTLRHPGDTLVSLYHFLRNYADVYRSAADVNVDLMNLDRMASGTPSGDKKQVGKHVLWYVQEQFQYDLEKTLSWLRSPETLAVRYEALWRDPLTALTQLTDRICPVSRDCIERAIEACDIGLMRSLAERDQQFFRQGGVGGWRTELPPEALAMLRAVEPYPTYTSLLGYTFDFDDPLTSAPANARTFHNPLRDVTHFDNGVPVAPILARLYLSVPSTMSARWIPVPCTASDESFFAWANAPSTQDVAMDGSVPRITNLAAYIYRIRSEVRHAFPDPFGADRRTYARWFIVHARTMYALDPVFIAPLLEGFRDWLNAPAEEDPRCDATPLAITNVALYLYHIRRDLQATFPDVFGKHRFPFARWFVEHGRAEFSLDETLAPLTTLRVSPASAHDHRVHPVPYEWLETVRLMEETFAAEREATEHYLTTINDDRANVRAYLAGVERDRDNVRTYLADVEEDRANVRAYLAGVEREHEQMSVLAVGREQALTMAYISVEEFQGSLRKREEDVERLHGDVEMLLVRLARAERFSLRGLLLRLRALATPTSTRILRCLLSIDASRR